MAEPKRFDAITIIGVAVGIALLVFGQIQIANKNKAAQAAAELQRQRDLDAEAHRNLVQRPAVPSTTSSGTALKPGVPVEAPAPKDTEAQETPPIHIVGDFLELTFSSRGGVLSNVRLIGEDENPARKDKKGLDLLAPIDPAKNAFGIPNFAFGTAPAQLVFDGKIEKSLDDFVWTMADTGTADANGNRIVTATREIIRIIPGTKDVAGAELTKAVTLAVKLTKTFTVNLKQRVLRCDFTIASETDTDEKCSYYIFGPQGVLLDGPPEDPKGPAGSRVSIQAALASRLHAANDAAPSAPDVTLLYAATAKSPDENARSVSREENLWGTVKNRFYMASLISLNPTQLIRIIAEPILSPSISTDLRLNEPNIGIVGRSEGFTLLKRTVRTDPYALYAGPADDREIEPAEKQLQLDGKEYVLSSSIQFGQLFGWNIGWVDKLARGMMKLFQFLHKFFGSFGLAVVAMTIIIKIIMHPIQRKMMISMSKMQKLQPEMQRIKDKYKNQTSFESKQKMQLEMNDLMSKAGASPLSGCLPMFIQLPVLAALYGIFNSAFDMRGATFLWIKDLSQPDRLYPLPFPHGSWIPSNLNLLPLLYVGLSFVQMRMTPQAPKVKSGDAQQDAQADMQKKMMMFMPIMISLMFYNMPAGLILYFTVSSLFGMMETWYIRRFLIKKDDKPATGTAVVPARG
jgi:YidC/Oxa1 family membrane protein insertase